MDIQRTPFRAITMVPPDLDPGSGAVIIPFPIQRIVRPAPTVVPQEPKISAVQSAALLMEASQHLAASFRDLKAATAQLHETHRQFEADAREFDAAAERVCERVAKLSHSTDSFSDRFARAIER